MRNGSFLTTLLILCFGTNVLVAQNALEKADKLYDLHAYRQAAALYEKAYNPDNDNAATTAEHLADCYWQMNDAEKAISLYAPLAYSDKASGSALQTYGTALMSLGQYEQAQVVFKKLKVSEPTIAAQMLVSCQFAASADNQPSVYKISPLSAINTPASELSVGVYQNQLIWASGRTDLKRAKDNGAAGNDWTGAANHQLFIADVNAATGSVGKAQFFKSDFKNVYNESCVSFSADGRQVAFMRSNITEGRRITSNTGVEMSIYTANVDDGGNFFDVKPYPYNNGASGFPSLSSDGQTLYFSSDRPGGFGGFDLYSVRRIGTTWGEPHNLGNAINTIGDEITPAVSDETFYFASNFQTGLGGYDIFKTSSLMTKVENMGVGVNSSGDDFGFVLNPTTNTGYFISNRAGGKGNEDIYFARGEQPATVASKDVKVPTATATVPKPSSSGVPVSYGTNSLPGYSGMITDGTTGEPLENVVVRVKNTKTNIVAESVSDKRGRFGLQMNKATDYEIVFSKAGFVNTKKILKPTELATKYIGETILKPSAVTDKIAVVEETPKATTATTAPEPKISVKQSGVLTKSIPTEEDIIVKPSGTKNAGSLSSVSNTMTDKKFYAVTLETVSLASKSVETKENVSVYEDFKGKTYDKIKELSNGNVYTVTTAGKKEVRLGVFATKQKAESLAKKINTYNLPNVFTVVEEKDYKTIANNLIVEKISPAIPKEESIVIKKGGTETTPKIVEPVSKVTVPEIPDTDFKVRIAAFKNPKLFDDSKVSKIGTITAVKQGDITIFMIDGFTYFDDAHAYKLRVQEAGYKDAKVVVKEGTGYRVVD